MRFRSSLILSHFFRHVARFCDSYLSGVASKVMKNIEQLLNAQISKFTNFEVRGKLR